MMLNDIHRETAPIARSKVGFGECYTSDFTLRQ